MFFIRIYSFLTYGKTNNRSNGESLAGFFPQLSERIMNVIKTGWKVGIEDLNQNEEHVLIIFKAPNQQVCDESDDDDHEDVHGDLREVLTSNFNFFFHHPQKVKRRKDFNFKFCLIRSHCCQFKA